MFWVLPAAETSRLPLLQPGTSAGARSVTCSVPPGVTLFPKYSPIRRETSSLSATFAPGAPGAGVLDELWQPAAASAAKRTRCTIRRLIDRLLGGGTVEQG